MADDFISNLQSLTSNLEEIVFTRFATVIKKNDDHTVDCREDSGTVHKNIKHSNLFNFQVGDTVILGFVDNDLYEPVIVGTRDVDLGVPTTEEIDELITDLNTLTTDMTNLKNSLIRFNGELISFSADNHNLAENLSKLKENLKFVLDDVKILDAGLGEFYDVLESFGIDIDEFVETLMGLNIDLNILQGYLSDFSGTLEQFDAKLRNELDEETYNKLNEDMVKLIWSISQVRGRTTTVEGQARNLANEIGDDTGYDPSTTQPANLKQWIKWIKWKVGDSNSGMIKDIEALEALIGDDTPGAETGIFADLVTANNHITTINSYIYGNGDAQHPASGSILYQINTLVNTDIPKILTDIYGKPDGTSSDYTANSLYGKLVYMENQLWGNGSSGSPSSDSILGRLGAISNNAGTGRLDLLDKQGGTLDTLDSRINGITNTGGTGSLDVLESTVGDNNSGLIKKANDLDTAIGSNTSGSESGLYLLIKNATDSITNITTNIIGSNTQGHETGIYLLIKNATDSIATINSKIGSDTSGSESGLYLAIKNAMDNISSINTKIGSDTSGSESGLYLLIKNAVDSISEINNKIGSNDSGTGSNTLWYGVRSALSSISSINSIIGTNESTTGSNTIWYGIRSALASITSINNILGTDESTTGSNTIWYSIRSLRTSVNNAESVIGTNSSTTGADTIWGRIRAYLTRLDNISNTGGTGALDELEKDVGDVNRTETGDLQEQSTNSFLAINSLLNLMGSEYDICWFIQESEDSQEIWNELHKIEEIVDVSLFNVKYVYQEITRGGDVYYWWDYDPTTPYTLYTRTTPPTNCVGMCYSMDDYVVDSHHPFDLIYEFKTNKFYIKDNGTWTPTYDATKYFEFTTLAYKIHNWQSDATVGTYSTLYWNPAIRLARLHVVKPTAQSFSQNSSTKIDTISMPSNETVSLPSDTSVGNCANSRLSITLNSSGEVHVRTVDGTNSAITADIWWHY